MDGHDPQPRVFSFVIPVKLAGLLPVYTRGDDAGGTQSGKGADEVKVGELAYLPSLIMVMEMQPGHPEAKQPKVTLSTDPLWLPDDLKARLVGDVERLWKETDPGQVVFTYIAHLRGGAEKVFGLTAIRAHDVLGVDINALLDYDAMKRQKASEKETIRCNICFDRKHVAECHSMDDCKHAFCVDCLQKYYRNAIKGGNVYAVRCPAQYCVQTWEGEVLKRLQAAGRKRKHKLRLLNPKELLRLPLEQEMVQRYVHFVYKRKLEGDQSTIYCPRTSCEGAAKSEKRRKPVGPDFAGFSDESDWEEEVPGEGSAEGGSKAQSDDEMVGKTGGKTEETDLSSGRLCVCEDCAFAFCSRCRQAWHGQLLLCVPFAPEAGTEEEKLSDDYVKVHTTACPSCTAPCQKMSGCNHANCPKCDAHFCWLCLTVLDPTDDLVKHWKNTDGDNKCYNRLVENPFEGDEPRAWAPCMAQRQ